MPVDLVCVGEIVADLVSPARELVHAGHFRRFLGGSAGNIAADFSVLGGEASLVSVVGDDPFGEFCLDALALKGVRLSGVRVVRGARTNLAFVSDSAGEPAYFPVRDPRLAFKIGETEAGIIARAEMLHLSAACLADPEGGAQVLRLLVARSEGRGPKVVGLDLGFIPAFHPRETTLQRLASAARHATFLKLSRREATALFGEEPTDATLERLCDLGYRRVILTLGAEGHIVMTDGKSERMAPQKGGRVRNASGAGDAFTAGVFLGLLAGLPFGEAAASAAKYARLAAARWEPQL